MCKWIKISSQLPNFGENVVFRAIINWREKDKNVVIFNDELTTQEETLEYGLSGYILKDKSDFIVCQHSDVGDLYDEIVTHWMPIPKEGLEL